MDDSQQHFTRIMMNMPHIYMRTMLGKANGQMAHRFWQNPNISNFILGDNNNNKRMPVFSQLPRASNKTKPRPQRGKINRLGNYSLIFNELDMLLGRSLTMRSNPENM